MVGSDANAKAVRTALQTGGIGVMDDVDRGALTDNS